MPRKRSVAGRARSKDIENKKMLMIQKANRRLASLQRGKNIGKYKSKELFRFISQTRSLSLRRARKSRRLKIITSRVKQTMQQNRLILNKLTDILGSKAFSNIGINQIRKEAREKAKKTLGEQKGSEITDADLDKFIEMASYVNKQKEGSILERVDPSDFQALINDAKAENFGVDQWTAGLAQIANLDLISVMNNEYMRNEAEELYYKYVV